MGTFNGSADFDPGLGVVSRSYTPGTSNSTAGYISLLTQKDVPQADRARAAFHRALITEGTTLAVGANIVDGDSTSFTYFWTVTQGATDYASGKGRRSASMCPIPGVYALSLTVTDESGNTSTSSSTIVVTNAAPARVQHHEPLRHLPQP